MSKFNTDPIENNIENGNCAMCGEEENGNFKKIKYTNINVCDEECFSDLKDEYHVEIDKSARGYNLRKKRRERQDKRDKNKIKRQIKKNEKQIKKLEKENKNLKKQIEE